MSVVDGWVSTKIMRFGTHETNESLRHFRVDAPRCPPAIEWLNCKVDCVPRMIFRLSAAPDLKEITYAVTKSHNCDQGVS
jgi:hypothetical protein